MKVLICGIGGRMGAELEKLALAGYKDAVLVAGVDVRPMEGKSYPTYTTFDAIPADLDVDCIIDFSNHACTVDMLAFATSRGVAWDDEALGIDWKIDVEKVILSEKDKLNKPIAEADFLFDYNTDYYAE